MSIILQLEAEKREGTGTGTARAVRRAGRIPAIVYGAKKEEINISLPVKEFMKEYSKGHLTAKLVDLKIGKDVLRVLPREVQLHPVTDKPLHVDFQRLEKGSKIHVKVQVKFLNADKSPGLKRGGVLNVVRHDVELVCDADFIPEKLEADLGECKIGDSIHISHIKLPEGIKPVITDRDFTIATIVGRTAEDAEGTASSAAPAEGEGEEDNAAEGEEENTEE